MAALEWAANEAHLRGATLEVVHANFYRDELLDMFGDGVRQADRAILDDAVARARELEPDLTVTGRICEPPATKALIDASEDAELLVVGSRGLSTIERLTLGSVSNTCAHHSRCPILIVRSGPGTRRPDSSHGSGMGVPDTNDPADATTGSP
jgi:nucleotide-binding universal stress UspA family protein